MVKVTSTAIVFDISNYTHSAELIEPYPEGNFHNVCTVK